ncbi:MAG: replicative DNA helicase [Blastocatellia bacterium]
MTKAAGSDFALEKALPGNIEAERLILGAILLDNTTINQAAERLKRDDFFLDSHRRIYDRMLYLSENGRAIDPITLAEELQRNGDLTQIGGPAYIAALFDGVPRFSNIESYVGIVKGKSMLRRLITTSNQIMASCFDAEDDPEEILDQAEKMILAIAEDRIRQGFTHISEIAQKQFEHIEDIAGRQQLITGIATGFRDLDYMTSGLQRGDLIIVAARPSMGKCLAADSEIVLADGSLATIEEIYRRRSARLLTLNSNWKFGLTEPSAFVDDGMKPVFRVTTRLGRQVESTLTHPYLTLDGWRSLAELKPGDRIAVPREISVFGTEQLSNEQVTALAGTVISVECSQIIPPVVFRLTRPKLALFLNRLFATDGWVAITGNHLAQIGYSTVSERLARQVQHLLLRFGIIAKLRQRQIRYQDSRRAAWQLDITHADSIRRFARDIGIFSKEEKSTQIPSACPGSVARFAKIAQFTPRAGDEYCAILANRATLVVPSTDLKSDPELVLQILDRETNRTNRDLIPSVIWNSLATAKGDESWQSLARRAGIKGSSNLHVGQRRMPRRKLMSLADAVSSDSLRALAESDVYWDEIISIEPLGLKQVYDLTIPETHNFVANDICVHNTAFSLNMAQNAALMMQEHGSRAVVGVFSLEMSKEQLVQRLMCSQARLDAHRLRSGMLSKDDWRRLAQAVGELAEADIYIDDTPAITTLELRAKARRLRQEKRSLDLLIVDYLQLMSGRGRVESRQQEVSQISRELKGIAKELNVPLIALSQLSRATETRTDHRPQLSDLRESGCLAGESLVTIADTGARVPIRELVGKSDFDVWALNEATMTLERASVSRAFATGVKPVFRLTTRLGRAIRATANHKFRTIDGWKRLDELRIGERLAMPRHLESGDFQSMTDAELALLGHLIGDGCTLPRHAIQYTTREQDLAEQVAALASEVFGDEVEPRIKHERTWYQVYLSSTRHHTHHTRSAVTEWLMSLGAWGLRSYEKRVPEKVFAQPAQAIALFLRHLWATDGCVRLKPGIYAPAVYYASSSERLATDVQSLLLRLGINAWLRRRSQKGKGRDQFHVTITGKDDLEKFADLVGATGAYKKAGLQEVRDYLQNRRAKTNRDVIPGTVWQQVIIPARQQSGITTRQLQSGIGSAYSTSQLYQQNISRDRAARIAQVVPSETLSRLAQSDVYWDEITSVEADGEAEVFDLTVDEHHNFIANDFIPHNSIEQDADLVMFIYRDEVYHPETEKQNTAEIIIGKQRNGPIGTVELIFLKQLTRFENKAYEG